MLSGEGVSQGLASVLPFVLCFIYVISKKGQVWHFSKSTTSDGFAVVVQGRSRHVAVKRSHTYSQTGDLASRNGPVVKKLTKQPSKSR